MRLIDYELQLRHERDRVEIYPLGDIHFGKRNCAEKMIAEELKEILRRSKMKDRQVRILLGGDVLNEIVPSDVRRFDFHDMADWLVQGSPAEVRSKLSNLPLEELEHAVEVLDPVKHLIIGGISGNHEDYIRRKFHVDVHERLCDRLGILNMSDEAAIRMRFSRPNDASTNGGRVVFIYLRHGYGGGRSPGAEPKKIDDMISEWSSMDVCLTGHTHTFCIAPPRASLYLPKKGLLPKQLMLRYRWGGNWGSWLYSHHSGEGSYESRAAYPARPFMTFKIVIWPFYKVGRREVPKIELRNYPILRAGRTSQASPASRG